MRIHFTSAILASVCVITFQVVTRVFFRRIDNKNCSLIMSCNFDQVPARSKGECGLLTELLGGSGSYYNISTNLCNVCKPTSNYIEIASNLGYYAKGSVYRMDGGLWM